MKFDGAGKIILGTGRVLANIDTPPCGGCRTSVELTDGRRRRSPATAKASTNYSSSAGTNALFRAYCQLAGIEVVPV